MKRLLVILVLVFSYSLGFSQTGNSLDGDKLSDRVYFGGNIGLQFGTVTNIELSPVVGYRFTDDFSAGIGITYIYFKREFDNYPDFETNIYGYRFFARHNIQEQFYAQAEYENLSLEFFNINDGSSRREWVPGAFIGGGYFQPLGRNAGFNITALYNVLYDENKSPYNSPYVIRVGLTMGF